MLDSDNEEDQQEIEKNKRLIKLNQRTGPNYGNTNPKMRKKLRTLNWEHDYEMESETSSLGRSPPKKQSLSPNKRRIFGKRIPPGGYRLNYKLPNDIMAPLNLM